MRYFTLMIVVDICTTVHIAEVQTPSDVFGVGNGGLSLEAVLGTENEIYVAVKRSCICFVSPVWSSSIGARRRIRSFYAAI